MFLREPSSAFACQCTRCNLHSNCSGTQSGPAYCNAFGPLARVPTSSQGFGVRATTSLQKVLEGFVCQSHHLRRCLAQLLSARIIRVARLPCLVTCSEASFVRGLSCVSFTLSIPSLLTFVVSTWIYKLPYAFPRLPQEEEDQRRSQFAVLAYQTLNVGFS